MQHLARLSVIFRRNRLLMIVISIAFLSILIVSAAVSYVMLFTSPELVGRLQDAFESARGYIAIPPPPPYTIGLYSFIFLNNIGHFWNPARVWVWLPFVGAYSLGYELLFNALVIGGIASFAGVTRGAFYTFVGLTPHGIIEIPAFILEFTALARWHVTATLAIYAKLSGRRVDRPLVLEGIEDTVALSLFSVALFAIAAYVEAFITPRFLGL